MKKSLIALIAFIAANAFSAELQTEDAKLLEAAGVPLHPKAMFIHGHKDIGFRFASNVPAEEVQQWYRAQLPDWALFRKEDSWILFEGTQGADLGEIASRNQVVVKHVKILPEWHSLDEDMTTGILIMVPQ